ncbi:hypothetical protein SAMD00019534_051920 [Acytostelium subglobosum LB1]|uniref:hypothetical protein n=1 Tax=Acytostelium subglobosum LB1 TaxID=1410327 RepID=UPI00064485E5|nr:hypothetical protein SAMD00019534_051920 [Acytostelium subglobosum LB1]GAM22017.1 hypothetical protein SAMD00019534_051920 [Acytostelium subglobosum LB1]|eukprot:XP_012755117.1 hypothetical protein SAMD00019534_051920 [Acytostelium subglobosum LB1]
MDSSLQPILFILVVALLAHSNFIKYGLVVGQVTTTTFTNPDNGHNYTLLYSTDSSKLNFTYDEATAYVASKYPKGYLATITTQREYNFVVSKMADDQSLWLGANSRPPNDETLYSWKTGPEAGQPLAEPQTDVYFWRNYAWDDLSPTEQNIGGILIEYGGEKDPVVWPTDCQPGNITITNLDKRPFNISNLKVTITNSTRKRDSFECTLNTVSSTSVKCPTPFMVGEYDILITDGVQSYSHKGYHPNMPMISSMYPGLYAGDLITINGQNFGDSLEYVESVKISTLKVACKPLKMLVPDRSFTCNLTASINSTTVTSLQGISAVDIQIGGVLMKDISRIAMYNKDTSSFIMSTGNYYSTGIPIKEYFVAEGLPCQVFSPVKQSDMIFVRSLFSNVSMYYPSKNVSTSFQFINGPHKGANILTNNVINSAIFSPGTAVISNTSITMTILSADYTKTGLSFKQLVGAYNYYYVIFNTTLPAPVFLTTGNFTIPTSGGWISLPVDNLKLSSSNYTLVLGGLKIEPIYIVPFQNNNTLGVMFGSGYGSARSLVLYVENNKTTNQVQLGYYPPVLKSLSIAPFDGGLVTLTGDQFGNESSVIQLIYNGDQSINSNLNLSIIQPHQSISFNIPPGLNQNKLQLNVGGQLSNILNFTYTDGCGPGALCSGRGQCIYGTCNCTTEGYNGPICNTTASSTTNVDPVVNPSSALFGEFSIFFTHIREMDGNGVPLVTYPVADVQWNINVNTTTNQVSFGTLSYIQDFNITVNITKFINQTTLDFGGQTILIDANSIKSDVTLAGWPFKSYTNTLELIYRIQSPSKSTRCHDSTISQNPNQQSDLRYIEMQVGDKVLVSKFINVVQVDSRLSVSNVRTLDLTDPFFEQTNYTQGADTLGVVFALVTPSFRDQAVIDPNFSYLTDSGVDSLTNKCVEHKSNWWIIAVAVGGAAILLAAAIGTGVFLKKRLRFRREDKRIDMISMNSTT